MPGPSAPVGPADRLVWTGNVDSRGQRITSPQLVAGNKYYIVVRGTLSEGTWYVNGNTLLNDACYEFNAQGSPQVLSIFQNSQGIIVCDNQYHPDHIYCSAYFDSNGQPISFSIFDTDYRDNSGSLQVEIYEVGDIGIDAAIDDLMNDEAHRKWDNQKIQNVLRNLNELLNLSRSLYGQFNINYNKLVNEVKDQKSNPTQNDLLALCLVNANRNYNDHTVIKDTINARGRELIAQATSNPDVKTSGIISIYSEVENQSTDMKNKLQEMRDLLASYGADFDEILNNGQQLAQSNANPEFAQDGGVNMEFPGDGVDNFGDGLQDYLYGNVRRGNVLIVVWDAGQIADDIFEVSLSGKGILGETPAGGRRNFDISLNPGYYTLTIKGIFTQVERCTFGLQVYDRDERIEAVPYYELDVNQAVSYNITIK